MRAPVLCFLSFALLKAAAFGQAVERPNIIIVLADDLGWSDLGCYGSEVPTPHLDRLAENGLRFTQMHNTAKCFPSRACLLTGLYAQQCGMGQRGEHLENATTLGAVLREAGYTTLAVGKHHGSDNLYDRGFDHYWGMRDGAANYFNPGFPRPGEPVPAQKRPGQRVWCFDSKQMQPFTPGDPEYYGTDAFTDWAIELLDRYKADKQPFFLYLAYQAPHDPLQAPEEDIARYLDRYRSGYAAVARARDERQRQMGLIDGRYPRSEPTHRDWDALSAVEQADQDRRMAVYAAMIDRLDRNIGRLVAYLKENGEWENTLFLFASDNGASAEVVEIGDGPVGAIDRWSSLGPDWANVSNTPFRYFKNWSHQGGICTPLIAHWPDGLKDPGRVSHRIGHFIDFMPTVLELTGAPYPETWNGQAVLPSPGESFLPILQGREAPREEPLFSHWLRGKAVIHDGWKLVGYGDSWELFHLAEDRTETRDLLQSHPQKAEELRRLWEDWSNSLPEN